MLFICVEKIRILIKEVIAQLFEEQSFDLLKNKLLAFGGNSVQETYEEDLSRLLTKGNLFKNKVTTVKMKSSRCHENSACFWGNYTDEHGTSDMKIVTGWALDSNGVWNQHTWLYQPSKDRIIETTFKRVAYYGFMMNDGEAQDFYFDNY